MLTVPNITVFEHKVFNYYFKELTEAFKENVVSGEPIRLQEIFSISSLDDITKLRFVTTGLQYIFDSEELYKNKVRSIAFKIAEIVRDYFNYANNERTSQYHWQELRYKLLSRKRNEFYVYMLKYLYSKNKSIGVSFFRNKLWLLYTELNDQYCYSSFSSWEDSIRKSSSNVVLTMYNASDENLCLNRVICGNANDALLYTILDATDSNFTMAQKQACSFLKNELSKILNSKELPK